MKIRDFSKNLLFALFVLASTDLIFGDPALPTTLNTMKEVCNFYKKRFEGYRCVYNPWLISDPQDQCRLSGQVSSQEKNGIHRQIAGWSLENVNRMGEHKSVVILFTEAVGSEKEIINSIEDIVVSLKIDLASKRLGAVLYKRLRSVLSSGGEKREFKDVYRSGWQHNFFIEPFGYKWIYNRVYFRELNDPPIEPSDDLKKYLDSDCYYEQVANLIFDTGQEKGDTCFIWKSPELRRSRVEYFDRCIDSNFVREQKVFNHLYAYPVVLIK